MRFTSFSLLFLTASFVNAKEDVLQQQPQPQQPGAAGVRSAVWKEGKKNIRGGLVSGESESNSSNNNKNHFYYNDNDVSDKDAIADVGILSLNSHHDYDSIEENYHLERDLQGCTNCCNGFSACYRNLKATIGDGSCNNDFSCRNAGLYGTVVIGEDSCIGASVCLLLALGSSSTVIVGDGSCLGQEACSQLGNFGDVTVGDESCVGTNACKVTTRFDLSTLGRPITIGNNACTCDDCCTNILPGSVVDDNACTNADDGCAGTLVVSTATPVPSQMPTTGAPSQMPSRAPSQVPSSAPSQMPSAADCGDFVCDSNPNLVEVCIVGRGGSEPTTQCIPKRAATPLLKTNNESKCGPCDNV